LKILLRLIFQKYDIINVRKFNRKNKVKVGMFDSMSINWRKLSPHIEGGFNKCG
jgi:hypothetical protein